jgi:hypothetical protein
VAKQLLEMDHRPTTPSPSCETASDGLETGRDLARRYLVDAVRLFAAVAFGDSEAGLHTKTLAARQIVTVAGIAPQAAPAPPPYEGAGDGA